MKSINFSILSGCQLPADFQNKVSDNIMFMPKKLLLHLKFSMVLSFVNCFEQSNHQLSCLREGSFTSITFSQTCNCPLKLSITKNMKREQNITYEKLYCCRQIEQSKLMKKVCNGRKNESPSMTSLLSFF